MVTFESFKQKALANPEVKEEYEILKSELEKQELKKQEDKVKKKVKGDLGEVEKEIKK